MTTRPYLVRAAEPPPRRGPPSGAKLVRTPETLSLLDRGRAYLGAGYAVHFRGPAGTGKTSLALELARDLGRNVVWIAGDDSFTSATLVGAETGVRTRQVVDRFVDRVTKVESDSAPRWVDQVVTTACLNGWTLVYDEFTRSPPEANNVLLPVLEERVLLLATASRPETRHDVHPDFRAIFTSNPADYAGVHETQDALFDRMITIDVEFPERATEIAIVAGRAAMDPERAARIVDLVRDYRASAAWTQAPTLRAALMIAEVAGRGDLRVAVDDPRFLSLCLDVLASRARFSSAEERGQHRALLTELIAHYCPAGAA